MTNRQELVYRHGRLEALEEEREPPAFKAGDCQLRTSLNGAILGALRSSHRRQESLLPETASTGVSFVDSDSSGQEVWGIVEGKLSDVRERRLAYLLFHCGLKPGEIVRSCPQEWSSVREISLLRLKIMNQLCD